MTFPWYEYLDGSDLSLQQGDIITDCPIFTPDKHKCKEGDEVSFEVNTVDGIVLTQSCDLANGRVRIVQLCPITPFHKQFDSRHKQRFGELSKGRHVGLHLLELESQIYQDYLVVNLRDIFGLPIEHLQQMVRERSSKRIRLLPPYRESLSQSLASMYMRVGLPRSLTPYNGDR